MRFVYYYMWFILYWFIISAIFWLAYFLLPFLKKERNVLYNWFFKYFFIWALFFVMWLGIYNFEKPIRVNNFTINSEKISKDYKVVHITDIQFWSVTKEYMEKVMALALAQKPDFIAMTWDLIDFDNYKEKDFEYFSNIDIPIYFWIWNHELYHQTSRLKEILSSIPSFKILNNKEAIYDDEIQLIWIDYSTSEDFYKKQLDKFYVNNEDFSILLFHEPKFVEYAASKEYDLQLYWHVHWWQIWPITELVDTIYEYSRWYFKINNTVAYVSEWAWLWGPRMRIWSDNEITVFNLKTLR